VVNGVGVVGKFFNENEFRKMKEKGELNGRI
jgi:hypothetical protein